MNIIKDERSFRIKCSLVVSLMFVFFISALCPVAAADAKTTKPVSQSVSTLSFNSAFYSELISKDAMTRDRLLLQKLNVIADGIVVVSKVEEKTLFKKKFRIVASSQGQPLSIIFHIYTENAEYIDLLPQGQKFEFKGQLVMITPVNSKRDTYIFDIILEDGAAVVE